MRRSVMIVGAVAIGLLGLAAFKTGLATSGTAGQPPIAIHTSLSARDMIIQISSHGRQPVTISHILINDRAGIADCDIHLHGSDLSAFDNRNNLFLSGDPILLPGNEFAVDVARSGVCGDTISLVHVDTDQGSGDFDIN